MEPVAGGIALGSRSQLYQSFHMFSVKWMSYKTCQAKVEFKK